MRDNTKRVISLVLIGLLYAFYRYDAPYDYPSLSYDFRGDTLKVLMAIEANPYSRKGDCIGFNYEVLGTMEKDLGCIVDIIHPRFKDSLYEKFTDSLNLGVYDLAIGYAADSSDFGIRRLHPISEQFEWYTGASNNEVSYGINMWIANVLYDGRLEKIEDKYFTRYNIASLIAAGKQRTSISPYDDIIKKYSKRLGWDWKLLAAQIYCESKFAMGARSQRGATGLMQIMPSTGKAYGVDDIFTPDNNVDAGTRHLRYLQKMFEDDGIDSLNLVKFTLAAYNAGEGRIADCRSLAAGLGHDPNVWEDVARVIPLMREEQYYDSEYVKRGRFKGEETIRYVRNVLLRYEEYKVAIK